MAWMQRKIYSDECIAAMASIDALLKKKLVGARGKSRDAVKTAVDDYIKFKALSLKEKVGVQRLLRQDSLTGLEDVDMAIASLPLLPDYVLDLRLSKKEADEVARRSMEALAKKSVNSVNVDASDLLEKCIATLMNIKSNAFDLAAAIALTCGRRMVEIFSVGSFDLVDGEDRTLAFSGQVKKRFGSEDAINFIPTLAPASLVLDAINRLRAEKQSKGLSNRDINLKWSNSCQSAARRLLGENGHFHELRAMYAVIGYNVTLPHSYSLNAFVSRVLGHAGLGNSLNYTNININNVEQEHKFQWSYLKTCGSSMPSPKRKPLREVIYK
jgi:Telomere resolvase